MISSAVASEIDAIIRAMEAEVGIARVNATAVDVRQPDNATTNIGTSYYVRVTENGELSYTPASIPENSKAALVDETTSRFSDALWFNNIKSKTIVLAGVGGIGSYVGFLLSRLHPRKIHLFDNDIVEAANMSGQLYDAQHVGQSKVEALADIMSSFSSYYDIDCHNQRYTSAMGGADIMICGFDNMEARRQFFNGWHNHVLAHSQEDRGKCLFIDGRLAAESFQVLCIKGDDERAIEKYSREFLFSDSEAEQTLCSYKQTSFMATMIASVIVNLFVNFCANECNPLIPRDLPFFTEYTGETMFFKVVS